MRRNDTHETLNRVLSEKKHAGCTKQACGFRDQHAAISAKGYHVYGMSADTPNSQLNWKTKYGFPYHLLSDRSKDRRALKALGVNKARASVQRSHLVIGRGGVVEQVRYGVSPLVSVDDATEFVTGKQFSYQSGINETQFLIVISWNGTFGIRINGPLTDQRRRI